MIFMPPKEIRAVLKSHSLSVRYDSGIGYSSKTNEVNFKLKRSEKGLSRTKVSFRYHPGKRSQSKVISQMMSLHYLK